MKNLPTPALQDAFGGNFEVVAPCEVDDKVGRGVEDEGEVVEAGQAEDPRADLTWTYVFSTPWIFPSVN